MAANLALAAVPLALCFFALELASRWWIDVDDYYVPLRVQDVDHDFPIRFLPGAERTYTSSEFEYTVRFNRFGRRDVEWTDGQIADPRNVLFVGDSFVLGNGVEHEDAIPTLLEGRLADLGGAIEVFNFGMPGGNPNTYTVLLDHALDLGFSAGTVVVGIFVGNDFYPQTLRSNPLSPTARRSLPAPPPPLVQSHLLRFLKARLATSPLVVGWALTLGPRIGIDVYDTSGSFIFLRHPTYDQHVTFERVLDYLRRMRELAEGKERRLRVVVFPNRIQVENREDLTSSVFNASRPNDRIVEYCAEQDIACLDLLPVLSKRYESEREALYFPIDRHLNERGTRVAADAIGAFLEDSGALR